MWSSRRPRSFLRPVLRAIAPPGEAALGRRDELRPISTQSCACLQPSQASTSTGVWLTTSSNALWLQTSHSSGATLKSPTMIVGSLSAFRPARHALDEVELLAELGLTVAVGDVAAGGNVDIFEPDAALEPRRRRGAPRHCPASRAARSSQRHPAEDRDAVMHPLPVEREMVVAVARGTARPGRCRRAPWFPAGTGCRAAPRDRRSTSAHARAHRVDVPGGDLQSSWSRCALSLSRAPYEKGPRSGGMERGPTERLSRKGSADPGNRGKPQAIQDRSLFRLRPLTLR